MKILGVIPARWASTRFPGKPLADIEGWPMIRHVYERARDAKSLSELIVATDHEGIAETVREFGGNVILTSEKHPTGTDRIIEVMEKKPSFEAFVNIQGDEPRIRHEQIDQVCSILSSHKDSVVATLVKKTRNPEEYHSPNTVKVVIDNTGKALYFSRHPIPFLREAKTAGHWIEEYGYWKHIGIYGYSTSALKIIKTFPPSPLEKAESLEQLRWMENGIPVFTGETEFESTAIDSPDDLKKLRKQEKQAE
jgi:3-deoxy-manno-octulosonate cytidylyltransferase (CMP-KDO synthetase)